MPVEIRVWTKDIGADYLIVRTGGTEEDRAAAEELAVLLDELPLAHEQAAAYCDELEIPFDEYRRRFETAPVQMLDDADASGIRVDVAKTFTLAIEAAGKRHPAAESLIVHADLLAPDSRSDRRCGAR